MIGLHPPWNLRKEYQRRVSAKALDIDVHAMPQEYHMAIVHGARIMDAALILAVCK